jgi:hypothetical protein
MEGALLFGKYSGLATAPAIVQNHQMLLKNSLEKTSFVHDNCDLGVRQNAFSADALPQVHIGRVSARHDGSSHSFGVSVLLLPT